MTQTIQDVMTSDPITLSGDSTAADAAKNPSQRADRSPSETEQLFRSRARLRGVSRGGFEV